MWYWSYIRSEVCKTTNIKAEIISWSYFFFWYSQNGSGISGTSGYLEVANLMVYLSSFASSLAHPHWHCGRHVDYIYNLHGHMLRFHFLILFVEWSFYGKHFATELWMYLGRSMLYITTALPYHHHMHSPLIWSAFFSIWPYISIFGMINHETMAGPPVYIWMMAHLFK